MSEYGLSKFVPLPDISPVLQKAASERSAFRVIALDICSVDSVEKFPPLSNVQLHRLVLFKQDCVVLRGDDRVDQKW